MKMSSENRRMAKNELESVLVLFCSLRHITTNEWQLFQNLYKERNYTFFRGIMIKTFNLEEYLNDDSSFKIGIEFGNLKDYQEGKINSLHVNGKFALGINGINIYEQGDVFWDNLNPLDYILFLATNLEHYKTKCENIREIVNPISICNKQSFLSSGLKDVNYSEMVSKHMLLPSRNDRQPIFIRNIGDKIEFSWGNSYRTTYTNKSGIELIDQRIFFEKMYEFFEYLSNFNILQYQEDIIKALRIK